MKKLLLISAAFAMLMSSCGNGKSGSAESANPEDMTRDSLIVALANQDSLLALMTDIQSGIDQIKALENILNTTSDLAGENSDRRQQIRNDIAAIQASIQQRSERLAELEKRLSQSNYNNSRMKDAIETLKSQIASQVEEINGLREDLAKANIQIDSLTQQVDTLSTTLAATNDEKIRAQEESTNLANELNTCYYAIGSKSELKEHNIIETGFLRKTKIMPADFEQGYFTVADKRTLTSIPLHSHKAKVLTNQPTDSYQIVDGTAGGKILNITDSDRFWNTSNYVVIQID